VVSTLGLFYSLTTHRLSLFAAAPKGGGDEAAGLGFAFFCGYFLLILLIAIPTIAGKWKVFTKAGQPGWAAIVPIYDFYVLHTEIAKRKDSTWFIMYILGIVIGCLFPLAIIALFIVNSEVAKKFGKGGGYGIGLTLLPFIFYPMLGFGDAQYAGRRKRYDDDDDDEEEDEEEERPRNRRRDEEEEEEERPQPKRRRDDEEDERPRNRRRDDDDDDDDRPQPKKRRRDDDD
jgi:hypothetical protein